MKRMGVTLIGKEEELAKMIAQLKRERTEVMRQENLNYQVYRQLEGKYGTFRRNEYIEPMMRNFHFEYASAELEAKEKEERASYYAENIEPLKIKEWELFNRARELENELLKMVSERLVKEN